MDNHKSDSSTAEGGHRRLRIALVSYEFPPSRFSCGIGTYMQHLATMLGLRGHHVEVFASIDKEITSPQHKLPTKEWPFHLHLLRGVNELDRAHFAEAITPLVIERHAEVDFEILEAPEIDAHSRVLQQELPVVLHCIKLHTPSFLINKLSYFKVSKLEQLRWVAGSLKRGKWPPPYPFPAGGSSMDEHERRLLKAADLVYSPSDDLANLVAKQFDYPRELITLLVNPLPISSLRIEATPHSTGKITKVLIIGRVEARKGALELLNVIPLVAQRIPHLKFVWCGTIGKSPRYGENMESYMKRQLGRHAGSLICTGRISRQELQELCAENSIVLMPSRYENCPYAVLEAMATGKAVISSSSGGITEIITDQKTGLLVDMKKPKQVAEAIQRLVESPDLTHKLARAGMLHVRSKYSFEKVAPLQEQLYLSRLAQSPTTGRKEPEAL